MLLKSRFAALLLASPLVGAASCEPPPKTDAGPVECFFGTRGAEPEMELLLRTVDGGVDVLDEGDDVPLILPPQGGKVILVGFRARNVDLCDLATRASVHDSCTATEGNAGRVVGLEGRPIRLIPGDDGWAYPEKPETLTNWANVPMCPNNAFTRDLDGQPYMLRLRMIELGTGRATTIERTIVPVCAEPEALAECECTCDADYFLGADCAADGGPGADGDADDPAPGECPVPPVDGGPVSDAGPTDGGGDDGGAGDAGAPDAGTADAG